MKRKKWIAGLSGFILGSAASPAMLLTFADEPVKIDVKQTVEEDLSSLDIDVEKYLIDPERVTGPILIAFNETNSEKYKSLAYFYDPLEIITPDIELELIVSSGNDLDHLEEVTVQPDEHQLHYVDSSSDGKIDRYYIDYLPDGNRYAEYYFDYLTDPVNAYGYDLDAKFVFDRSGMFLDYSNCLNVLLGDPHAWSWHFDEDSESENNWEAFKSWMGFKNDVLRDQLFYSFYVKNWKVSEIKSIDLKYKKVLLDGYRYNQADTGSTAAYYKGSDATFRPKYYAWSNSNNASSQDRSKYLGSSLAEIETKVSYTTRTIVSEEKTSIGVGHHYDWKTIQNRMQFEATFPNSEIARFASNYFTEDEDYWIINFDEFFYHYDDNNIFNFIQDPYVTNPEFRKPIRKAVYEAEDHKDFVAYLKHHNTPYLPYIGPGTAGGFMKFYNFTQEYVFDIRATEMTFEDAASVTYTLPVSVAAVDEEGSGGTSTPGNLNSLWNLIQRILDALGSIGVAFLWLGNHWIWFAGTFLISVILRGVLEVYSR